MRQQTNQSLFLLFIIAEFPSVVVWTGLCAVAVFVLYARDLSTVYVPVVVTAWALFVREMYCDFEVKKKR